MFYVLCQPLVIAIGIAHRHVTGTGTGTGTDVFKVLCFMSTKLNSKRYSPQACHRNRNRYRHVLGYMFYVNHL